MIRIQTQTRMDGATGAIPGSAMTDQAQLRLTVVERQPNRLLLRPAAAASAAPGSTAPGTQQGHVVLASDATLTEVQLDLDWR